MTFFNSFKLKLFKALSFGSFLLCADIGGIAIAEEVKKDLEHIISSKNYNVSSIEVANVELIFATPKLIHYDYNKKEQVQTKNIDDYAVYLFFKSKENNLTIPLARIYDQMYINLYNNGRCFGRSRNRGIRLGYGD